MQRYIYNVQDSLSGNLK